MKGGNYYLGSVVKRLLKLYGQASLKHGHHGLMMRNARPSKLYVVTTLLLLKNTFSFALIIFKISLNFQNKADYKLTSSPLWVAKHEGRGGRQKGNEKTPAQ
ncbi:hypothetical protein, partial [Escherichia coli]|uniref:hypothetical protein n=1 Tax=Escherichia coli TaxID=562 RepID=UPI0021E87316